MNKKGFTLIELLVVIAIIGILSSIAIVYLSDARQKANNSKVQSNITTAATQLELDRANGLNQDGVTTFSVASDVPTIITKLGTAPCAAAAWNTFPVVANLAADTANVAFYSTLCTTGNTGGDIFCADSQGFRGNIAAAPTAGTCN